ncbi:uncharacterized protein LOC100379006 [Saccoglossus kowalevskii]|uniref:Zinc finger protein 729-like n=1 Tax=Saccoglossus kowalevskii TaxID=10224 RepID=A0ABM0GL99_SACKO|nr:PREDICTED: zinc finger protein 729-like [Saccoglossus kowalevskii]
MAYIEDDLERLHTKLRIKEILFCKAHELSQLLECSVFVKVVEPSSAAEYYGTRDLKLLYQNSGLKYHHGDVEVQIPRNVAPNQCEERLDEFSSESTPQRTKCFVEGDNIQTEHENEFCNDNQTVSSDDDGDDAFEILESDEQVTAQEKKNERHTDDMVSCTEKAVDATSEGSHDDGADRNRIGAFVEETIDMLQAEDGGDSQNVAVKIEDKVVFENTRDEGMGLVKEENPDQEAVSESVSDSVTNTQSNFDDGDVAFLNNKNKKSVTGGGSTSISSRTRSKITYNCEDCNSSFTTSRHLSAHLKRAHNSKEYSCTDCNRKLKCKNAYIRHMKNAHSKTQSLFSCSFCQKTFMFKSILNAHEKCHTKPFLCDICGKSFSSRNNLKTHKISNLNCGGSDELPTKCSICEVQFQSVISLQSHIRSDHGGNRFQCKTCGKGFRYKSNLVSHLLVHSGEKPYKCDFCDNTYQSLTHCKNHAIKHHGQPGTIAKPSGKRKKPQTHKCDVCNRGFCTKSNLEVHKKTHLEKLPYTCDICKRGFLLLRNLNEHMISHGKGAGCQCDVCGLFFRNSAALGTHKRTHTTDDPTSSMFDDRGSTVHLDERFKCNICDKVFRLKCGVKNHLLVHSGDKPYKCSFCDKAYQSYTNCHQHEIRYHGKPGVIPNNNERKKLSKTHTCDECDRGFCSEANLELHKKSHLEQLPFSCHICKRGFILQHNLNEHMKKHDEKSQIQCDTCGKLFINFSALIAHQLTHKGNEPQKCELCAKEFSSLNALKIHTAVIHTNVGIKPPRRKPVRKPKLDADGNVIQKKVPILLKCELCTKSFKTETQMGIHLARHKGLLPFECGECGKSFKYVNGLKVHKLKHTGEKPYKCEECGAAYQGMTHLKLHKKKFHGVDSKGSVITKVRKKMPKDYKCDLCGKAYSTVQSLEKHQLWHSGNFPFSCQECGRGFLLEYNYKEHLKIHRGELNQKCSKCDKAFCNFSALEAHTRSAHEEKSTYFCEHCGKTFHQLTRLKLHITFAHTKNKEIKLLRLATAKARKAQRIAEGHIITKPKTKRVRKPKKSPKKNKVDVITEVESWVVAEDNPDIECAVQEIQEIVTVPTTTEIVLATSNIETCLVPETTVQI